MVKAVVIFASVAFILRVKRLWYVTSDITTVGVTVTFYCSCNFVTADTVGLGCIPFLLPHLVIFC